MKCLNEVFVIIPIVSDRVLFKYALNKKFSEKNALLDLIEWQKYFSISDVIPSLLCHLRAAIKYHTSSGLNKRNAFSHSSAG